MCQLSNRNFSDQHLLDCFSIHEFVYFCILTLQQTASRVRYCTVQCSVGNENSKKILLIKQFYSEYSTKGTLSTIKEMIFLAQRHSGFLLRRALCHSKVLAHPYFVHKCVTSGPRDLRFRIYNLLYNSEEKGEI